MEYPVLRPIKNGWGAYGVGWAVHGKTKEEAIANYHEAEERRRRIMARPAPLPPLDELRRERVKRFGELLRETTPPTP